MLQFIICTVKILKIDRGCEVLSEIVPKSEVVSGFDDSKPVVVSIKFPDLPVSNLGLKAGLPYK